MISGIIPIQVVRFKKCATKGLKASLHIYKIIFLSPVLSPRDKKTGFSNDNLPNERRNAIGGKFFHSFVLNLPITCEKFIHLKLRNLFLTVES